MARIKAEVTTVVEWVPGIYNIGCFRPEPAPEVEPIWQDYLKSVSMDEITKVFFNGPYDQGVGLFDLSMLTCFWFRDRSIKKARHVWFNKPRHYSAYIFDKETLRLEIAFRQSDIDGEHWRSAHLHVLVGTQDLRSVSQMVRPIIDKHVPIIAAPSRFSKTMRAEDRNG